MSVIGTSILKLKSMFFKNRNIHNTPPTSPPHLAPLWMLDIGHVAKHMQRRGGRVEDSNNTSTVGLPSPSPPPKGVRSPAMAHPLDFPFYPPPQKGWGVWQCLIRWTSLSILPTEGMRSSAIPPVGIHPTPLDPSFSPFQPPTPINFVNRVNAMKWAATADGEGELEVVAS